jgi:UDP-N-acetylmuramate--L-alanine ligase/UDP-N-acetylenolpyruvoylglucosamine reductase
MEPLRAAGATLYVGHRAEQVQGAAVVVRSSAIPNDNVEVRAAQAAGIPVVKRQDFLGQMFREWWEGVRCVAVAGTHGKTTTTAMIAWMMTALNRDPSYIIGGVAANLGRSAYAGRGPHFVIEADEYDGMFLGLQPYLAVVTNVDYDHPDCYPTQAAYAQAFEQFTARLQSQGTLIACADDPGAAALAQACATDHKVVLYGTAPAADLRAVDLVSAPRGGYQFRVVRRDGTPAVSAAVSLQVPGEHNVRNALAALAVADALRLSLDEAALALASFRGAGRRFELRGEGRGVTVIDDYAHHPTEIRATLAGARARYLTSRIWAVWQPHTYSRTRLLQAEFSAAFAAADQVLVLPIYAARETPPADGYTAATVTAALAAQHPRVSAAAGLDQARQQLLAQLEPGDVVVVLSAGDADGLSGALVAALQAPPLLPVVELPQDWRAEVAAAFGTRVQRQVELARFTAARIGGPADFLLEATSADDLAEIVQRLWEIDAPWLILGGGSNVLVSDLGVRGVVILNRARQVRFDPTGEQPSVWAEAGANFGALARQAAAQGLGGLAWAAGIPGTVGGAVVGNAGAHGQDMTHNLLLAEILHRTPQDELPRTFWNQESFAYGYRTSRLKRHPGEAVVLSAELRLERADPAALVAEMAAFQARRRSTQPPGASMGSMFKNPPGDAAGRLIEAAGLKGVRRGGAEISPVHANFIVNREGARATDVAGLLTLARRTVAEKFGVELELEIELLGEWLVGAGEGEHV